MLSEKVVKIVEALNLSSLSEDKVNSLKMLLKKLSKTSLRDAKELILFLSGIDIFYACRVLKATGSKELLDIMQCHIKENIQCLVKIDPIATINSMLLIGGIGEDKELYRIVESDLENFYSGSNGKDMLLLLHRLVLENAADDLLEIADELFARYFLIYNEEYKMEVSRILDISYKKDLNGTINSILKIIGTHGLFEIIGEEKTLSILRIQIISENATIDVWHQYIDYYSNKELSVAEELVNYSWFIPIYADDQQDAYIYAIWRRYDKETTNPYYTNVWDIPSNPKTISEETRQFVRGIMNQQIEENVVVLAEFLKRTPYVSPFYWDDEKYANEIANKNARLYSNGVTQSLRKLERLIKTGVSIDCISSVYFNTYCL